MLSNAPVSLATYCEVGEKHAIPEKITHTDGGIFDADCGF